MKRYILLLCIMVLAISVFAQKKGDTKIIIDKSDFDSVTVLLYENGYRVEMKDDKLKIISTKTKDLGSIGIRLQLIFKDSTINLSGEVVDRAAMIVIKSNEPIYTPIKFGGMQGSTRRDSWNELLKIASLINHIIRYE